MRFLTRAFRLCGALFATTVLFAGFSMSASQAGERWDAFVDDLPSMPRVSIPDIPMPRVYVPDVRLRWRQYGEPAAVQPPVITPVAVHPSDRFGAGALSSSDVALALRANGYSMLGQVSRRGPVYTAAVLNPRGDDGVAVIDARSGVVVRFIPGFAGNARLDTQLTGLYGLPNPPAAQELSSVPRIPKPRVVTRDVSPKPADRTATAAPPVVTSSIVSRHEPAKPETAKVSEPALQQAASTQANPADAQAEIKPAPAPQPAAKTAADLKLWPTMAAPDVQPLD